MVLVLLSDCFVYVPFILYLVSPLHSVCQLIVSEILLSLSYT